MARNGSIAEIIGDPVRVDAELRQFQRDSEVLSDRRNLLEKYPQRSIAIYDGALRADSASLSDLMGEVEKLGLPRERVVVRIVEREPTTMLLPVC